MATQTLLVYSKDIKKQSPFSSKTNQKLFEKIIPISSANIKTFVKDFDFNKTEDKPTVIFVLTGQFYLKHEKEILKLEKNKNFFSSFLLVINKSSKIISKIKVTNLISFVFEETLNDLIPNLDKLKNIQLFKKVGDFSEKINEIQSHSNKVLKIGMILSTERNIEKLMNYILHNCMDIVSADAGSLAIRGFDKDLKEQDKNLLTYYASKNTSKEINFNRFSMPINLESLAGYSILKKKVLNIPDAYKISKSYPYKFNNAFDKHTGFRTKSMLVIPMIDSQNNVIGVIQLLNKKKAGFNEIINYDNFKTSLISHFNDEDKDTVVGVANLASVLFKNQLLYNQVNLLFENFVKASVYAVEQRDPATSGHSDRVAKYTVQLAINATKAKGVLESYQFNDTQIRELRYAALLHDFGKIGVREKVLVKANKLEDDQLNIILKKIRIYLLNFQIEAERKKVHLYSQKTLSFDQLQRAIKEIDESVKKEINKFNQYQKVILDANDPHILEEKAPRMLDEISKVIFKDNGIEEPVLNKNELQFLKIRRGSLSEEERKEIEDHVTQSFQFLEKINWTQDLSGIPQIAYSHHEKLDGTGYPRHLHAKEIPPQAKIMTICDIYDALTASDRPYKKSVPTDKAIMILHEEAKDQKIDKNLLGLFIKTKVFEVK